MTILTDIPEWSFVDGRRWLNFPTGGYRIHSISCTNPNGEAQSMAGWDLKYVWRNENGNAVVEKTTEVGGGIEVTADVADVTLDPDDTVALPSGRYFFALWKDDENNGDPIAAGTLVLSAVAVRPVVPTP